MEAKSSWICESERELSSVIVELHQFPVRDNTEFLALLDEEKCISLRKPPNSPSLDCSIIIDASNNFVKLKSDREIPSASKTSKIQQLKKDNMNIETGEAGSSRINSPFPAACLPESSYITEILILSEAKFVETFVNSYQEYYQTFQSNLISQFEDSNIYKTIIVFQKPEVSVLLKLKGLFCEDSLWIYGIFIKTNLNSQATSVPIGSNQRSCDLDSIILEKGVTLSEKADKFKKLYQVCNGAQSQAPLYLTESMANFSLLNRQEEKDSDIQVLRQLTATANETEKYQDKGIIPIDVMSSPKQTRNEVMEKMLNKMGVLVTGSASSGMPPSLQALLNSIPHDYANKATCLGSNEKIATSKLTSLCSNPNEKIAASYTSNKVGLNPNDMKIIEKTVDAVIDRKLHEFEKRIEYNMNKSNEMIHKRLDNIEFLLKKFLDIKWNPT